MINSCLKCIEDSQDLHIVLVDHLQKTKKENGLDKACFQHDMAYGSFKDLNRRAAVVKVSRDKAFNIAKNPKHDGYQRGTASMVYKCFDKKRLVEPLRLHGRRP